MSKANSFLSLLEAEADTYYEIDMAGKRIFVATEDVFKKVYIYKYESIGFGSKLVMDVSTLTRGNVYKAVLDRLGEYDTAYPIDWAKDNRQEIERRGGAIWFYPENNNPFRKNEGPVFWDSIFNEYKKQVLKKIKAKDYIVKELA